MKRKGIILAGGNGTRLYPITLAISKQLLPIYDKPMIYYPLTTLMLADIREYLVICTPKDIQLYKELLGNGEKWGIRIDYAIQKSPDGIAQALIIAEKFLDGDSCALILGDNIYYGDSLSKKLKVASDQLYGATIFVQHTQNPKNFGVIDFDEDDKPLSIEEKPEQPKSNFAITGLYFYDEKASDFAKGLKPSARGELEITDINNIYLNNQELSVEKIGRGYVWLDAGTHESYISAQRFVQTVEQSQGLKIGCPEEIAFRKGWINKTQIELIAQSLQHSSYGKYLMEIT